MFSVKLIAYRSNVANSIVIAYRYYSSAAMVNKDVYE